MKNILKNTILLILIFNCYSITAQSQKKQLIGNWIFDYEKSLVNIDGNAKKALTKLSGMESKLERSYRNRQITFYDNGNFLLRIPNGKKIEGNWEMNTENSKVILIKTQTFQQNLILVKNLPTELVLRPVNTGKAKPMFATWYFKKI